MTRPLTDEEEQALARALHAMEMHHYLIASGPDPKDELDEQQRLKATFSALAERLRSRGLPTSGDSP